MLGEGIPANRGTCASSQVKFRRNAKIATLVSGASRNRPRIERSRLQGVVADGGIGRDTPSATPVRSRRWDLESLTGLLASSRLRER
jgi:hypothetical protein